MSLSIVDGILGLGETQRDATCSVLTLHFRRSNVRFEQVVKGRAWRDSNPRPAA